MAIRNWTYSVSPCLRGEESALSDYGSRITDHGFSGSRIPRLPALLAAALLLAATPGIAAEIPAPATSFYCRALHLAPLSAPAPPRRPLLGITFKPAPASAAGEASPCPDPILVEQVFPGSAADGAGLRSGDIILSLDGKAVCTKESPVGAALPAALANRRAGEAVVLELLRDGSRRRQTVHLGARPTARSPSAIHPEPACPETPSVLGRLLEERGLTAAFAVVTGGLAAQPDLTHGLAADRAGVANPLQRREFTFLMRHPLQAGLTAREMTEPFAAAAAGENWQLAGLLRPLAALADASPASSPPTSAAPTLPALVAALEEATAGIGRLLGRLSPEELEFLRTHALAAEEGADWNRFLAAAPRIKPEEVLQALSPLTGFLSADALARLRADLLQRFPDPSAPILYRGKSRAGTILIGGTAPTTWDEDAALILDLGGDDLYRNNAGGSRPQLPVALVVDWAGDDRYLAAEDVSQGAGLLGAGLLLDLGGDDLFVARDASQGAGILGVGVLLHRGDRGIYRSRRLSQGAGSNGLGLLLDHAGDTLYQGGEQGQGFGALGGVGVLLDQAGNDSYRLGGLRPDFRDPEHATVSMGQGFGLGVRPATGTEGASGGIGVLFDGAGDDTYLASYFAQGAAYYYGVGILRDRQGNDRYQAGRYAQGAGIHSAVGVLVDERGDDSYDVSFGVSQGLGHDYGFGLLEDEAGDDRYRGGDLVRGAATSGSLGLLLDGGGRDDFESSEDGRDGGIGVLLELENP